MAVNHTAKTIHHHHYNLSVYSKPHKHSIFNNEFSKLYLHLLALFLIKNYVLYKKKLVSFEPLFCRNHIYIIAIVKFSNSPINVDKGTCMDSHKLLFQIDARSSKKTWFTFMTLQQLTSQGCHNFQLFNLGKITINYYTPVTCYHVIPVIIQLNVKVKGICGGTLSI